MLLKLLPGVYWVSEDDCHKEGAAQLRIRGLVGILGIDIPTIDALSALDQVPWRTLGALPPAHISRDLDIFPLDARGRLITPFMFVFQYLFK